MKLTKRESEVAALLPTGATNKEIGKELGITDSAIKFHLMNICSKLGATNRTHAAVLVDRAARAGASS